MTRITVLFSINVFLIIYYYCKNADSEFFLLLERVIGRNHLKNGHQPRVLRWIQSTKQIHALRGRCFFCGGARIWDICDYLVMSHWSDSIFFWMPRLIKNWILDMEFLLSSYSPDKKVQFQLKSRNYPLSFANKRSGNLKLSRRFVMHFPKLTKFQFPSSLCTLPFLGPFALHRTRLNTEATRTLFPLCQTSVFIGAVATEERCVILAITVPRGTHQHLHSLRNLVRFSALRLASSGCLPLLLQSTVKMAEPEQSIKPVRDKNELQIMKVPVFSLFFTWIYGLFIFVDVVFTFHETSLLCLTSSACRTADLHARFYNNSQQPLERYEFFLHLFSLNILIMLSFPLFNKMLSIMHRVSVSASPYTKNLCGTWALSIHTAPCWVIWLSSLSFSPSLELAVALLFQRKKKHFVIQKVFSNIFKAPYL